MGKGKFVIKLAIVIFLSIFLMNALSVVWTYSRGISDSPQVRRQNNVERWNQTKHNSHLPPECPTFPIAKAERLGALGNHIATYANHISLQWQYGYQVYLSQIISTSMDSLFSNVSFPSIIVIEDKCNMSYSRKANDQVEWRSFLDRKNASCMENMNVTNVNKETFLHDCVREHVDTLHVCIKTNHNKPDWPLCGPHMPELQKYHLQIKEDLKTRTQLLLHKSVDKLGMVFVGVHVRRTEDFAGYKRFGHPMVDEKYFLTGMDHYRKKYGGSCVFILASDSMDWCRDKFTAEDVYLIGGISPAEDLALLAACNHSLVSYGSFGLWAGLFAGGEVIVPHSILLYKGTSSETTATQFGWTTLKGF